MSVGDLFWLFFMFTAIQPMLRQRMLEAMRARKIAQLEGQRHSRVILLVHRQETMRLLGFPIMRYIDINDSEDVLRAIQMTDEDVPLDLVLHTPGGLVLAALQIAKAVRDHKAKVTVFVPHYAMSGGTLIALAADEIVMCKHSVLGPIDPQLGQSPAASLIKVVQEKPIARVNDETLVLADIGRKAISQLKQSASELLQRRLPAEQASALAEKLTVGTWTHDYPIWASTARELGMPVSTDMPDDVLELMTLYPQPTRMQSGSGGVEYLPVPRQKEAVRREA
ncbi:MAG: SDH family Clp fold serine proteinase [Usitatibacter sp.]|jgi:ClpP class serine protease